MSMDTQRSAARSQGGIPRPVIAIALAALLVAALGPIALAAQPDEVPGNNGTVKIHEGAGEPASEVRNEPHVCTFHLHFFFADAGDSGTWEIQEWSPGDKGEPSGLSGTYMTDANGEDRDPDSGTYSLPDGHYKLFWDGDLDTNKHDKHKVFWVDCEAQGGDVPPPPGGGNGGGGGGPPEGEVLPTEGVAPTPPSGGGAPTQGAAPTGGVAGAAATPRTTLPPTDTADQPTSGSAGLWATLLLLIAVITTVSLVTAPVSEAQRGRGRR
jgi:hypothetical protein